MYILRSSPARTRPELLHVFDEMIQSSLASISNCDMTDLLGGRRRFPSAKAPSVFAEQTKFLFQPFWLLFSLFVGLSQEYRSRHRLGRHYCSPDTTVASKTEQTALPVLLEEQKQWDSPMLTKPRRNSSLSPPYWTTYGYWRIRRKKHVFGFTHFHHQAWVVSWTTMQSGFR